jgi:hypothetical protein
LAADAATQLARRTRVAGQRVDQRGGRHCRAAPCAVLHRDAAGAGNGSALAFPGAGEIEINNVKNTMVRNS